MKHILRRAVMQAYFLAIMVSTSAFGQQPVPDAKPGWLDTMRGAAERVPDWLKPSSVDLSKITLPNLPSFSGMVAGQFDSVIEQMELAVPVIEQLGFEVKSFRMSWTLPPAVHIQARSRNIQLSEEEQQLILESQKGNKLIYVVAQSLIAARKVQRSSVLSSFSSVVLDISLALPPKIDMVFQDDQDRYSGRLRQHKTGSHHKK